MGNHPVAAEHMVAKSRVLVFSIAEYVVLMTNVVFIKTGLYEASLMTIIRCGPTRKENSDR